MNYSFYVNHRNDVYNKRELRKHLFSFVVGDGGLWIAKDSRKSGNAHYYTSRLWSNLDFILWQSVVLSQLTKVYVLQIPENTGHKTSLRMKTMTHPFYTIMHERMYTTGKKSLTLHDLTDFDTESLAYLIQDDGYLNVTSANHYRIGICTESFSEPECKLLRDTIADTCGVHANVIKYKHKTRLQFNRKQTDKVIEVVTPHFAPSYLYKIRQTPTIETVTSWCDKFQDDGIVQTLLKNSDQYRKILT